jgi:hypothetical protein
VTIRRCIALILGLALCGTLGCKKTGSPDGEFYHPRKQINQWDEDYDHCSNAASELSKRAKSPNEQGASIEECMKAKGYIYGTGQITVFREADFAYENDVPSEFYLMDGIYHNEAMAKTRFDYLKRTSVDNATIRRTSGGPQTWWLILIGNYKDLGEAKKARRELQRENGLVDVQIIKQEYGPRSRGELMLVP